MYDEISYFKRYSYSNIILIIILKFITANTVYGQSVNSIRLNFIQNRIVDSLEFEKVIKNTQVIGIGEATHGDHQSNEFRKVLIFNLIKDYGYNFICIEETNDYVKLLNKIIHSDKIVHARRIEEILSKFDYWIWKTQEFVEIVMLLHSYNLDNDKKIEIIGVDTFGTYNFRDSIMAEKIYKITESGDKAIFLAHNYHVSFEKKDPYYTYDKKWTGEFLKEKLGSKYYSIGFLFNSGCFNAFYPFYGLETYCVRAPSHLNKMGKFFKEHNYSYHLIDFNKLNNLLVNYSNDDYNWHIGNTYDENKGKFYYKKSSSLVKSWDAVFFVDTITESKNFNLPGNFGCEANLNLGPYSKNKILNDSFKVFFKFYKTNYDSTFITQFYMKSFPGNNFNNKVKRSDFYQIKGDSSNYYLSFPIKKEFSSYSVGFFIYGHGQILISDFKISSSEKIYTGNNGFKFIGGNRFGIKKADSYNMFIYSLE
jgi:hypothetical protein